MRANLIRECFSVAVLIAGLAKVNAEEPKAKPETPEARQARLFEQFESTLTNAVLTGIDGMAEALQAVALALPSPYVARDLVVDVATLWLGTAVDPADTATVDRLIGVLLGDIPEYEWDPTAPGAGTRLVGLALHLAVQPEYQLS